MVILFPQLSLVNPNFYLYSVSGDFSGTNMITNFFYTNNLGEYLINRA